MDQYLFWEVGSAALENVVRATKREVGVRVVARARHTATRLKVVAGLAEAVDAAAHRSREIRVDCLELYNFSSENSTKF